MDTAIITIISGAGLALSSAIAALWKRQNSQHDKVCTALEKCELKHDESQKRELALVKDNAVLAEKVTAIEAKVEGYKEAKDDLRDLSAKVIEILSREGQP